MSVYALNLFDVADRDEYLAYSKRSVSEVARYGGRVVALGKFRENVLGEVAGRQVLILVEWPDKDVRRLLQRPHARRPARAPRGRDVVVHLAALRSVGRSAARA
jgi:uncharacterized protein (DUF1330 family)